MTYVIGGPCIDVVDRSCVEVCPVDCIYVGDRKSYINATECIDCGACEVECPVSAIAADRLARKDPELAWHLRDSADFFAVPLPTRTSPLGNPGGAQVVGELGVDTAAVTELPRHD